MPYPKKNLTRQDQIDRVDKLGTGEYKNYFEGCEKYKITYAFEITYDKMVDLAIERIRYDKTIKITNLDYVFAEDAVEDWQDERNEQDETTDKWAPFIEDSINEIVGCISR